MIDFIIVLVCIIIIFLLTKNIKEHFYNTCNFVPYGPNLEFCKNRCQDLEGRKMWNTSTTTKPACTEETCNEICISCEEWDGQKRIEKCPWINKWDKKSKREIDKLFSLNLDSISAINDIHPQVPKLTLSGYSQGNSVILTWDIVGSLTFGNEYIDENYYKKMIKSFLIQYIDTSSEDFKINIININDKDVISYEIKNLEENTEYTFVIYGLNDYNMSERSNIIYLQTTTKLSTQ